MPELFDLSGRAALVTESARGIGFALAEGLAKAGASVILNGTRADTVAGAVARLGAKGFAATGRAFDVTDEHAVAEAFAQWDKDGVHIEILINNAGIQFREPLVELELSDSQRVIDTNLTSAFIVSKQAAKRMIARIGRQDREYRFADERGSTRNCGRVHRGQGWHQDADACDERRMSRAEWAASNGPRRISRRTPSARATS
jgi:NAD(P)-dependent dehydrogenase (short-subunit alcohol dehydrogenase family)